MKITAALLDEGVQTAKRLAESFNIDYTLSPFAVMFCRRSPTSGKKLDHPDWIVVAIPDARNSEEEARALRQLTKRGRAEAVLHCAECWLAEGSVPDAEGKVLRPSLDPDRFEAVVLSVETVLRDEFYIARITRDATGRPTLGPWEKEENALSAGRLAGLLPKPAASA